jgi:hypothetical protein
MTGERFFCLVMRWTTSVISQGREWLLSVEGERFRVRLGRRNGHLFGFGYTSLSGSNDDAGLVSRVRPSEARPSSRR